VDFSKHVHTYIEENNFLKKGTPISYQGFIFKKIWWGGGG